MVDFFLVIVEAHAETIPCMDIVLAKLLVSKFIACAVTPLIIIFYTIHSTPTAPYKTYNYSGLHKHIILCNLHVNCEIFVVHII